MNWARVGLMDLGADISMATLGTAQSQTVSAYQLAPLTEDIRSNAYIARPFTEVGSSTALPSLTQYGGDASQKLTTHVSITYKQPGKTNPVIRMRKMRDSNNRSGGAHPHHTIYPKTRQS